MLQLLQNLSVLHVCEHSGISGFQVWRQTGAGGVTECSTKPKNANKKNKKNKTLAKVINNSSIISPKERRRRKRGGKAYFMAGWLSERRHPVLSRLHMM